MNSYEARLRILLDARKIWDGGIGVYIQNLAGGIIDLRNELGGFNSGLDLTLLGDPRQIGRFEWASDIDLVEDDAQPYSLDEMVRLPKRIAWGNYDLFHVPHYTLPYGVSIPSVVTVHDLIHLHFPERWYYPLLAGHLIRSAVKRATRVITVSEASYRDLGQLLRGDSTQLSKVRVVSNAVDGYYFGAESSPELLWKRFALRGPYFLSVVSNGKPHKGIPDLVRALQAVSLELPPEWDDVRFVVVGRGAEGMGKLLNDSVPGAVRDRVVVLGELGRSDLGQLYAGAEALIVSSLAEGFCLPIIEARAAGTPVICRPVPAIRELVAADDVVARDLSGTAFTAALSTYLHSRTPGTRIRASQQDRERMLSNFDRKEIARSTLLIYLEALACTGKVFTLDLERSEARQSLAPPLEGGIVA